VVRSAVLLDDYDPPFALDELRDAELAEVFVAGDGSCGEGQLSERT
jgi:hypothetical protein